MHIRCGLVPLIRKNICSHNSEFPSRASEALELDGAALHMLSTGEDEVLRAGGGGDGGRQGGAGRRRRARGWVGCRTCFTTRLTHPRDVVGRHGAELDGGAEA